MTDERSAADLRDKHVSLSAIPVPSAGNRVSSSPGSETSLASAGDPKGEGQGLTVQSRDRIASQLRAMYDTVASQPVPDRFAELIAQLDSADRS